jgi:outer membrane murein-binding lipoprotein Lpp
MEHLVAVCAAAFVLGGCMSEDRVADISADVSSYEVELLRAELVRLERRVEELERLERRVDELEYRMEEACARSGC